VVINAKLQSLLHDRFILAQVFLVVAVATGLIKYDMAIFSYYAEIVAVLLISLFAFTRSWKVLIQRLVDIIIKGGFLGILMLIIIAFFRGRKDHSPINLGSLWWPMIVALIYCVVMLLPVLVNGFRSNNPVREWVDKAVSQIIPIAAVLLIALFVGQIAFAFADTAGVAANRLLSTILMAIAGLSRVAFGTYFGGADESDYAEFMGTTTIGGVFLPRRR
jgi:hypothetical protein